jgi:autotransporter-associated beta strand protein
MGCVLAGWPIGQYGMRRFFAVVLVAVGCACCLTPRAASAATLVVVQNEAGFEGLEEPTVIYFPASNTFQNDPTNYQNHVDEGGGLFRDTLRNEYPTPLPPYTSGPGWWDGDGADSSRTDRQRSEPKGIVGLGHQQVEQTFEYSFDFRTNPGFTATSNFCHVFQLKATNGDDSPPLATISLYKNGSGIQGRVDCFTDGTSGTPQNEIIPTTFSYTAGQWIHFVIRITPCAQGETTGGIQLSVNGGAFNGVTNQAIDLQGSTDFRPKFGFYRQITTSNGVPAGDSWVEHRTITGYIGTSNILTWQGGLNSNTWDTAITQNFLNGSTASAFNTIDQVFFNDSTSNTTVNLSGNVWPGYTDVNATQNYTFTGSGSLTGGTLRKEGSGTLTLATNNSYAGLTDVRAGVLYVTGSIGNNSLVSITGGTLKAGATGALGTNSTIGTQINGGTLDINGINLTTEPVSVQGSGVGNAGAIVNNGAQQTSALTNVTLTGDTTLGGSGRWDIRGSGAQLSTGGGSYNLTKTGGNQVSLVTATVDAALGNITINQGVLAFQTSTSSLGDPTKNLTIGSGAILGLYNSTGSLSKLSTLNGGTIWAESGTGSQNTFSGAITLGATGGILDAGSALTGGAANSNAVLTASSVIGGSGALAKNGPGTVSLTGSANTYGGGTTVNAGTLIIGQPKSLGTGGLTINGTALAKLQSGLGAPVQLPSFTIAGGATPTAKLDVMDNNLVVHNGNINTTLAQLRTGLNLSGTLWTGAGITSSIAAADAAANTNSTTFAVGAIKNIDRNNNLIYSTWPAPPSPDGGATGLTTTDVLVKYTYFGDADLNGVVDNTSDYDLWSNGFANPSLAATNGWLYGDFDFSGTVDNTTDYDLWSTGLAHQGSALSSGAEALAVPVAPDPAASPVPEPSGIVLIVGGLWSAARFCRRGA